MNPVSSPTSTTVTIAACPLDLETFSRKEELQLAEMSDSSYGLPSPSNSDQSFNNDIESPNDMLVDSDDILADAENEKDDLAIITPDSDVDQPSVPRADDCMLYMRTHPHHVMD